MQDKTTPYSAAVAAELAQLPSFDLDELVRIWKVRIGRKVPLHLPRYLLVRLLAYPTAGSSIRQPGSQPAQPARTVRIRKAGGALGQKCCRGETEARER